MQQDPRTGQSGTGAEARSVFRTVQHTLPFRLLLKGFLLSTRFLPVWFLRFAGFFVAFIFILFNPANFRAVRGNLAIIRPGRSGIAYAAMAFGVFKNYAYYLIDLFHVSHDPARVRGYNFTLTGQENLKQAQSLNRGIILLTTHFGNWEIGGVYLASHGTEICVVYAPDSSGLLEDQRKAIRRIEGVLEVALKPGEFSSLKLLRLLQEKKMVALQGDRLTFDSGISVPFFGRPARFPKGPVKLGLASGCVILPVFVPIAGYKSYDIIIEEPIIMETMDNAGEELGINLGKIITIFEKHISRRPTQWYSFMPFWEEDKKEESD